MRKLQSAVGRQLSAALMLLLLTGCVSAQIERAPETLVLLVRHAEQGGEPTADPPLTERGRARAEALAHALQGAGVDAIIVSSRARTRQTAQPLANLTGITPEIVPVGSGAVDEHVQEVARRVQELPSGSVVLVVGHSNTIPAIAAALGVTTAPAIADTEFDALYVVRLPERGAPRFVRARY